LETIVKKLLEGNAIRLGFLPTKCDFGYYYDIKPHEYHPKAAKNFLPEAEYGMVSI
jgi:hypothetical protein